MFVSDTRGAVSCAKLGWILGLAIVRESQWRGRGRLEWVYNYHAHFDTHFTQFWKYWIAQHGVVHTAVYFSLYPPPLPSWAPSNLFLRNIRLWLVNIKHCRIFGARISSFCLWLMMIRDDGSVKEGCVGLTWGPESSSLSRDFLRAGPACKI